MTRDSVHHRILLIVVPFLLVACFPFVDFMWFYSTVLLPIPNCYPTCEFSVYLHPFVGIGLFSSKTRYVANITWGEINTACMNRSEAEPTNECKWYPSSTQIQLIQASIIIALLFTILAYFLTLMGNISLDILLLTVAVFFARLGLGVWNSLPLINDPNSVLLFWNVTLKYTGDVISCGRRSCQQQNDFDVVPSNYSQNIIEIPFKTKGNDTGWYLWVAGLSILVVVYVVLLIYRFIVFLDHRDRKRNAPPEQPKRREEDIILT